MESFLSAMTRGDLQYEWIQRILKIEKQCLRMHE